MGGVAERMICLQAPPKLSLRGSKIEAQLALSPLSISCGQHYVQAQYPLQRVAVPAVLMRDVSQTKPEASEDR